MQELTTFGIVADLLSARRFLGAVHRPWPRVHRDRRGWTRHHAYSGSDPAIPSRSRHRALAAAQRAHSRRCREFGAFGSRSPTTTALRMGSGRSKPGRGRRGHRANGQRRHGGGRARASGGAGAGVARIRRSLRAPRRGRREPMASGAAEPGAGRRRGRGWRWRKRSAAASRTHDVSGLTTAELERTRRDLRAALALARSLLPAYPGPWRVGDPASLRDTWGYPALLAGAVGGIGTALQHSGAAGDHYRLPSIPAAATGNSAPSSFLTSVALFMPLWDYGLAAIRRSVAGSRSPRLVAVVPRRMNSRGGGHMATC